MEREEAAAKFRQMLLAQMGLRGIDASDWSNGEILDHLDWEAEVKARQTYALQSV